MTLDECQDCAACCFSETVRRVRVTEHDRRRLGPAREDLVVDDGDEAFMRIEPTPVGRCAALAVVDDGRFACTVYERRPETCRSFARGSVSCLMERALKRDRPRRLLEVIGSRR